MTESKQQFYLSPQQNRLWYYEQKGLKSVVQARIKVSGELSILELKDRVAHVARENKILRTIFPDASGRNFPCQEFWENPDAIKGLQFRAVESTTDIDERLRVGASDVNRSMPAMFELVRQKDELFLLVSFSAYMADPYSLIAICEQLNNRTQTDQSKENDVDYFMFSQWQEDLLKGTPDNKNDFWKDVKSISTDHFSSPQNRNYYGLKHSSPIAIPSEIYSRISKGGITLETFMLSCWVILLNKHCKNSNLTLGYSANRREFEDISSLLGLVSKSLPLTVAVHEKASVKDLCREIAASLTDIIKNQFNYNPTPLTGTDEHDIQLPVGFEYLRFIKNSSSSKFILESIYSEIDQHEIKLNVAETEEGTSFHFTFDQHQFSQHSIEIISEQLLFLMHKAMDHLDDPISFAEDWNGIMRGSILSHPFLFGNPCSIGERFEMVARTNAQQIATGFENRNITYEQFSRESDRIASVLAHSFGIVPGDRVGVLMGKSELLPVIFLAVLKAGAAYVPMDPSDSKKRLTHIINDSHCALVIHNLLEEFYNNLGTVPAGVTVDLLKEQKGGDGLLPSVDANAAAYIIYTSGTSGLPKGVVISHQSLINYVDWLKECFGISPADSSVLMTSHAFDLGYTSLWGTLLTGGRVFMIPEYLIQRPEILMQNLLNKKISFLKTTPSMFSLLFDEGGGSAARLLAEIKVLFLGGEKIKIADVEKAWNVNPSLRIINHYGPTESTVGVAAHELKKEWLSYYNRHTVIGSPCWNNTILILDEKLSVVPKGISGTIYVAGANLSSGYYNNESLTNSRFQRHEPTGLLVYNTGDQGLINLAGELEIIGRIDRQIKINGFRVELGEVELGVGLMPEIKQAVVLKSLTHDNQLICYYTSESKVTQETASAFLADILPKYMIPAIWVRLQSLPITINGKVDYAQLSGLAPEADKTKIDGTMTEFESQLVAIWQSVLGIQEIGPYDNFFYLGGDSIKAIKIAARLHKLGYDIKVKDIFELPSISQLASTARKIESAVNGQLLHDSFPLTPIMHDFFDKHPLQPSHYNYSSIFDIGSMSFQNVSQVFKVIFIHHEGMRMSFREITAGNREPYFYSSDDCPEIEYTDLRKVQDKFKAIETKGAEVQAGFSLNGGLLWTAHFFESSDKNYLLLILHHLITDAVSWNILSDDLEYHFEKVASGQPLTLPEKTASFSDWAFHLQQLAGSPVVLDQLSYWRSIPSTPGLAVEDALGSNTYGDEASVRVALAPTETMNLRKNARQGNYMGSVVCGLAAIGLTCKNLFDNEAQVIMMESHGREDLIDLNVSRTLGWFTTLYPIYFRVPSLDVKECVALVADSVSNLPTNGIAFGLLKHSGDNGNELYDIRPSIRFNYLGELGKKAEKKIVNDLNIACGSCKAPQEARPYVLDIVGFMKDGGLEFHIAYSRFQYTEEWINQFVRIFKNYLAEAASLYSDTPMHLALSDGTKVDIENFFTDSNK